MAETKKKVKTVVVKPKPQPAEDPGLSMTDSSKGISSLGVFSFSTPATIGDDYVDAHKRSEPLHSVKGERQFQTSPQKKGQNAGNWGQTARDFKLLFEGEPYSDPHKTRTQIMKERKEKTIHAREFKPSSATKEQSGAGDYIGSFTKPIEHMGDGRYPGREPRKKTVREYRRAIYTSPHKKGSFGTPNTLIGGKEHPFLGGQYDEARIAAQRARALSRQKVAGRKPFSSQQRPLQFFDGQPSTGVSRVHTAGKKAVAPPLDASAHLTRKQAVARRRPKHTPWAPNTFAKAGQQGAFQPFPEYTPDPYNPIQRQRKMQPERLNTAAVRKKHIPAKLRSRPAFRPTSVPRKQPVSSIFTRGIYKATLR